MARFNFGAGNTAKLLRAPLFVLGRVATAFIPRSRDQWVFGSGFGMADGGLALYLRATEDHLPATWLATGRAAGMATGLATGRGERGHAAEIADAYSLRGFWRTARARVIVVTHGFGDVNRYATAGALVVQLWHGIPLKRLGLDSPATARLPARLEALPGAPLLRRVLTAAYRWSSRRIDVIPVASPAIRGRLESAFALRETAAVVTGEPRVDVLSTGTLDERRAAARALIEKATGPLPPAARLILYAPTWRDGARDPAIPSAVDWRQIAALLDETGAVLLIRSHPLGAGSYTPPAATPAGAERIRSLPATSLPDVLPALAAADLLVTDYSSLAFEAGLVDLPTVFLAPDLADYQRTRGIYGSYDSVTGGRHAADWPGALEQARTILADPAARAVAVERARALTAATHTFADGRNTERLYRVIRARYDAPRDRARP